jgi:hypothetical protein
MLAWACGERRIAALSVPGRTPISSMNRPRPERSEGSSTRGIDRPTQGAPLLVLAVALFIARALLPSRFSALSNSRNPIAS